MRVILLKGGSAYDALRVFIDEIEAAFIRRGDEVRIIDLLGAPDFDPLLNAAAAGGPWDLVFSFNILAEYRDAASRSIGEILQAPHVFHYVDHPFTHLNRLERTGPAAAIMTIDRSHGEAIRSAYPAHRFGHICFCPHAAIGEQAPAAADTAAFMEQRPIPVLFSGTFYKAGDVAWANLEPRVRRVFQDAFEIANSAEWMSATLAMDAAMRAHGLDPDAPEHQGFRKNSGFVHEHVRLGRRFDALKAAAKAGVPLHVYGKGYEKHLYRFRNVTYGGEAHFRQVVDLMRQSRVVLNINANFGQGSHERPLTALLAGAAVATDASTFYAENFDEGRDLLVYRWKALAEGMEALAELARDPARARDMAMSGQQKVVAGHRWDHRLATIIAAADAVRAAPP